MKIKLLSFRKLLPVAASAMLLIAGTANAQTERQSAPATTVMQVGTVTERSSAVNLKTIGKEVAPGVLEVDPNSVRGKRFIIPRDDQTARVACIGKWKNGECRGIYIEW